MTWTRGRPPTAAMLDTRVAIERPVPDDSLDGAGSEGWAPIGAAWAYVKASAVARSETQDGDQPAWSRRSVLQMRYRTDIRVGMRLMAQDRVMYVIAQPAELGRRGGIEIVVEERFTGAAA